MSKSILDKIKNISIEDLTISVARQEEISQQKDKENQRHQASRIREAKTNFFVWLYFSWFTKFIVLLSVIMFLALVIVYFVSLYDGKINAFTESIESLFAGLITFLLGMSASPVVRWLLGKRKGD